MVLYTLLVITLTFNGNIRMSFHGVLLQSEKYAILDSKQEQIDCKRNKLAALLHDMRYYYDKK